MNKVVVVGSINIDMGVKVSKMPEIGETVVGADFFWSIGGKGTNQAVAAAKLGIKVSMIAKIGNDPFKTRIFKVFQEYKINTKFISQDKKNPSGMAIGTIDKEGNSSVIFIPGANSCLSKKDIDNATQEVASADIMILQLEVPLDTVAHAVNLAHKYNLTVILDPAPARKLEKDVLTKMDILTPNKSEAEKLTGIRINNLIDARKSADKLKKEGVKTVIVTLGKEGALLVESEETKHFRSHPVKTIDTTAAGDAFIGGLSTALAKGRNIREAVKYANIVAALSVTKLGAKDSLPSKEEVEKFLKTLNDIVVE